MGEQVIGYTWRESEVWAYRGREAASPSISDADQTPSFLLNGLK